MSQLEYQEYYERNLPHFQPPEATLFVTFRLDGSLPDAALEQWRIEKKRLEMTLLRWAAISPPETIPDPEAVAEEKLKFRVLSMICPLQSPMAITYSPSFASSHIDK